MNVYVYWNSYRRCWSIKALTGNNRGRVVEHAQAVVLRNAEAHINEDGHKYVHEGIEGTLVQSSVSPVDYGGRTESANDDWMLITYEENHQPVQHADRAVMLHPQGGGPEVWIYNANRARFI